MGLRLITVHCLTMTYIRQAQLRGIDGHQRPPIHMNISHERRLASQFSSAIRLSLSDRIATYQRAGPG